MDCVLDTFETVNITLNTEEVFKLAHIEDRESYIKLHVLLGCKEWWKIDTCRLGGVQGGR